MRLQVTILAAHAQSERRDTEKFFDENFFIIRIINVNVRRYVRYCCLLCMLVCFYWFIWTVDRVVGSHIKSIGFCQTMFIHFPTVSCNPMVGSTHKGQTGTSLRWMATMNPTVRKKERDWTGGVYQSVCTMPSLSCYLKNVPTCRCKSIHIPRR